METLTDTWFLWANTPHIYSNLKALGRDIELKNLDLPYTIFPEWWCPSVHGSRGSSSSSTTGPTAKSLFLLVGMSSYIMNAALPPKKNNLVLIGLQRDGIVGIPVARTAATSSVYQTPMLTRFRKWTPGIQRAVNLPGSSQSHVTRAGFWPRSEEWRQNAW